MKIYTKKGDKGETSILGGKRTCKCCLEMKAIGEVDELNAVLGMLVEDLDDKFNAEKKKLINIQKCLFVIGANIASVQTYLKKVPKLRNLEIKKLENWIDAMEKNLPILKTFIIPGGSEESAWSHLARAVCRRAERAVIGLSKKYKIDTAIKKYLNRLSDCLFVLGRWLNKKQGVEEVKWRKSGN